jgi:hypothetical protein
MILQNTYDGPLPSGTAASAAYINVNSTGVNNAYQRWNVYICPNCGFNCDSPFEFEDSK